LPRTTSNPGNEEQAIVLKLIQSAGQWAFLRLEQGGNVVFGEHANPLYHLGAIAFFMFWVVLGTGILLFVFFDTGLTAAYASVEDITQQWYFAGLMRSLHRYASDVMVVAMLLHMLRHLLFDHHRGFRWFSWVSGVIVLWVVYASGINGYMLPWDRLAQFVTTATFEWLDWLPIFAEPIARNVLHEGSVNDRLFTLLVFMHIGIPLFLGVLLYVHTQRVARAETIPARPIAIWVSVALLALSFAMPVVSQGPANLDTVVASVNLDWFLLAVYPLIYEWGAGKLWMLVGIGTAVLLLLPWLPPQRRAREAGMQLTVRPGDYTLVARPGETILEAGLRAGVPLPFDCRSGGCGLCKCTIRQGTVDYGAYLKSALSDAERAAGRALMCSAVALSDLELECPDIGVTGDFPVRTFIARVVRLEKLAPDVMRLLLRPEGGVRIEYHAGQYLNVLIGDGERRAFSFATAPHESDLIEFHIRLVPGGTFTTWVFNAMKEGDEFKLEGPLGRFYLREESDRPIVFLAGATGFAPVKSMIEHAFHIGLKRKMYLYWGTRNRAGMYMYDLAERWAKEHDNFAFIPVLSEPRPENHWQGRVGYVHEAVLQDFPTLVNHEVYACGSMQMVEAAHTEFRTHGMADDLCFSDAFFLAPHIKTAIEAKGVS
jgi:NAD(P)H-flavin reductase/ferredoxin